MYICAYGSCSGVRAHVHGKTAEWGNELKKDLGAFRRRQKKFALPSQPNRSIKCGLQLCSPSCALAWWFLGWLTYYTHFTENAKKVVRCAVYGERVLCWGGSAPGNFTQCRSPRSAMVKADNFSLVRLSQSRDSPAPWWIKTLLTQATSRWRIPQNTSMSAIQLPRSIVTLLSSRMFLSYIGYWIRGPLWRIVVHKTLSDLLLGTKMSCSTLCHMSSQQQTALDASQQPVYSLTI